MSKIIVTTPEDLERVVSHAVAQALDARDGEALPYVTVSEASKLLGRSPKTVLRYVKLRRLEASKLAGGNSPVMVSRASIERVLRTTTR